jgi:hypothetical protein
MILALLLALPAGAADVVALRAALAFELRAVAGDDVGWGASNLLLESSVALRLGQTPPGPDGRPATASYATGKAEITIDEALTREKDEAVLARRVAPTVVHELEHARADLAVPGAPVVLEGEWTAYAAQAVYLKRRLAQDPDYLRGQKELGRLRGNYEFLARAAAGGLDGLRRACEAEGVFKGLRPAAKVCGRLSGAERKACEAAVAYYRARLAELRPALE